MSAPLYFEDFPAGKRFTSGLRTVDDPAIRAFAEVSGDKHPLHLDDDYARRSPFGERIAHGLLGLSVASGLIDEMRLLRDALIAFAGLEWRFKGPIRIGDTLSFEIKVARTRGAGAGKGLVVFDARLVNQRGETVQEGEWALLMRKRP